MVPACELPTVVPACKLRCRCTALPAFVGDVCRRPPQWAARLRLRQSVRLPLTSAYGPGAEPSAWSPRLRGGGWARAQCGTRVWLPRPGVAFPVSSCAQAGPYRPRPALGPEKTCACAETWHVNSTRTR